MKNGGKSKSVAFIILFSVSSLPVLGYATFSDEIIFHI